MVGVARDAGHDVGVARLHRARRAPQRHDAARAAEGHVVEPARREAEVLGEADRGVGREREARDGETVDLVLLAASDFRAEPKERLRATNAPSGSSSARKAR